ncbi:MAG: hypothetical protein O4753_09630, partial [Trichodesmium sp. St7_bin2_1]|nr:hypothetical protein [Trichodesmium sp. St7_bin2_1]
CFNLWRYQFDPILIFNRQIFFFSFLTQVITKFRAGKERGKNFLFFDDNSTLADPTIIDDSKFD